MSDQLGCAGGAGGGGAASTFWKRFMPRHESPQTSLPALRSRSQSRFILRRRSSSVSAKRCTAPSIPKLLASCSLISSTMPRKRSTSATGSASRSTSPSSPSGGSCSTMLTSASPFPWQMMACICEAMSGAKLSTRCFVIAPDASMPRFSPSRSELTSRAREVMPNLPSQSLIAFVAMRDRSRSSPRKPLTVVCAEPSPRGTLPSSRSW
mmetsp:Transcript_29665/g.94722  ORF Transcript_29665/g.94722 Transcript_29665/m.94722 type:complete len:209 (+) Transcript_29665:464-1090(+)